MATLSPRARRRHDEMRLVHERNAHHVLELVGLWGLAAADRARIFEGDDVRLHFAGFETAEVRTVADVWAHR